MIKLNFLFFLFLGSVTSRAILFGVALGSFFSHGLAILFGSRIGLLENPTLHYILEVVTYISFILMGIISLLPKKELEKTSFPKQGMIQKLSSFRFNYIFIIALTIMIGELGDKTFLASIGFGIEYPTSKLMLILGAILGMVVSDSLAILCGKFLNRYISETTMQKLSGILFLIFGIIGFLF